HLSLNARSTPFEAPATYSSETPGGCCTAHDTRYSLNVSGDAEIAMRDDDLELLQGTLDVLVLKTLSWGPRHGYAVARWIAETSAAELQIEEGALYTALHRLE